MRDLQWPLNSAFLAPLVFHIRQLFMSRGCWVSWRIDFSFLEGAEGLGSSNLFLFPENEEILILHGSPIIGFNRPIPISTLDISRGGRTITSSWVAPRRPGLQVFPKWEQPFRVFSVGQVELPFPRCFLWELIVFSLFPGLLCSDEDLKGVDSWRSHLLRRGPPHWASQNEVPLPEECGLVGERMGGSS